MTLESNLISLYFCILSAQKHFLGRHLQDSAVAGDGGWMSVLSWTDGLRFLSKRETTYEFDDFFFFTSDSVRRASKTCVICYILNNPLCDHNQTEK